MLHTEDKSIGQNSMAILGLLLLMGLILGLWGYIQAPSDALRQLPILMHLPLCPEGLRHNSDQLA